jgi:dimethylaniline monooxygenase (N-oxide forming)
MNRVLVIGAGSAGITAAKALAEAGVPFDCFEKGPHIGGNWVLENPNGMSACYSTLEMNTSGSRMQFSDFPMGIDDYPMHWEVRDYFDRYAENFGIRERITFNAEVERVERLEDGTWEATVAGEGVGGQVVNRYRAVVVANGHHWDKRWPDPPFPGSDGFAGEQIHGHDYRGPQMLEGRRVVVVGAGNSGMDLARDASHVAEATYLSVRRGVWVIRKRIDGKPVDQTLLPAWLPWRVKQKAFEYLRRRSGDPTEVGLPQPDHKVGHAHPTLSDQIYDRLAAGAVEPKPNIREIRPESVVFEDGSEVDADLIVYCTGYSVSFPFFDPELISAPGNDLPLYRRVFHPDVPGVYFIGLAQPLGAIMPIAEEQGRWVADLLAGRYALPPREQMLADMAAERSRNEKRFYRSARHTMEIDFEEYLVAARKERRAGAKRAQAGSGVVAPAPLVEPAGVS